MYGLVSGSGSKLIIQPTKPWSQSGFGVAKALVLVWLWCGNFTLNKTEKYQLSANYYYIFHNIVIFFPINIEKFYFREYFPKSLKWPKQFCEPGSGTFSTSANIVRRTLNLCPNHKLVFKRYLLFSLCSVAHSGCTAIQDR